MFASQLFSGKDKMSPFLGHLSRWAPRFARAAGPTPHLKRSPPEYTISGGDSPNPEDTLTYPQIHPILRIDLRKTGTYPHLRPVLRISGRKTVVRPQIGPENNVPCTNRGYFAHGNRFLQAAADGRAGLLDLGFVGGADLAVGDVLELLGAANLSKVSVFFSRFSS